MSEEQKDVLLTFKSTKKSKDSKDADRLQLYMSVDELFILVKTAKDVVTDRGVVLDVHTGFRKSQKTGKEFLSTYGFIRGIQEPKAPDSFAPKAESSIESKIDALKNV